MGGSRPRRGAHRQAARSRRGFLRPAGASGLYNVPDADTAGVVDVVAEWEEAVGGEGHTVKPPDPGGALRAVQGWLGAGEQACELSKLTGSHVGFGHADLPIQPILA